MINFQLYSIIGNGLISNVLIKTYSLEREKDRRMIFSGPTISDSNKPLAYLKLIESKDKTDNNDF